MTRLGALPFGRRLRLALLVSSPLALGAPACTCDETISRLRANAAVEPESLDFGRVALGGLKQLELGVRNKGPLRIELTGFAADAPFVAPAGTASVAAGAVVRRKIGFMPTALGPVRGTLRIETDIDAGEALEVPLVGEGIQAAVRVEPASLDFGEVLWLAGALPDTRTVTVSNPGTDTFELTALELTGDGGHAFTLDPMGARKSYAPGESGTFTVSFLPNARGTLEGSVTLRTTAPEGETLTVPLGARVVGPEIQLCEQVEGQAEACATPTGPRPKLSFAVPRMGSGRGTIRAHNVGDRDLHIGAVVVTGAAAELSFVPAPSQNEVVVAPGQSAPWAVTYTPQDYAFDSVIVSFASDSRSAANPTGPSVESMRVEGSVLRPDLQVVPRNMTFHLTGAAHRGVTRVQLFNCGTEVLTLGQLTLAQDGGGTISVENAPAPGTQIPPQAACMTGPEGAGFDVVFDSTTNGNYVGRVDVPSDDPVNPTQSVGVAATKD